MTFKFKLRQSFVTYVIVGPRVLRGCIRKILNLDVKLIVQELIELDVKKEQLEVMGWMRLIWQDSRLSWSEEMFGIRELRVFPDNIWTPDVVIINSAQELPKGSHLPATVDSTGMGWIGK